jgi:peptide/nickel transport system substrate-binding protein
MKPFSDDAERLDQVVYMTNQEQYEPMGEDYAERDVDGARQVLEDAGYTQGSGGVYEKDGQRLSFRLSTTAGNELREQQGELIQNHLREVGIDIRIDNIESTVLFGEWLPGGNFDIANFAWVGGVFPISGTKQIYETGSDSNYGNYTSEEFDQLAGEGVQALDEDEQADIGNQMAEVLATDLPVLPLYQKPTFLGIRDTFTGVEDNSTNEGPFWNSHVWGMRTQ